MISGSENGDLLSILQASARSGTLLSSCEPEVKELMHQLDILLSSQHRKHEDGVARLTAMLEGKEVEIHQLKTSLKEKVAEIEHLRREASKCERDYRVHSADCDAQLVRLRSEVSRISQSYEQLKEKRYRHQKPHHKGLESERKQELDRSRLREHHIRKELEKEKEKVRALQVERTRYLQIQEKHKELVKDSHIRELEKEKLEKEKEKIRELQAERTKHSHCHEADHIARDKIIENFSSQVVHHSDIDGTRYTALQPSDTQETAQLLEDVLEQHFQQLNTELLKVFDEQV